MNLDDVPTEALREELALRLCNHEPQLTVNLNDYPDHRPALITCKCGKHSWIKSALDYHQIGLPLKMSVGPAAGGVTTIDVVTADGKPYRHYSVPRKEPFVIGDIYAAIGVELPDSTRW
jgi:hypothetical protein